MIDPTQRHETRSADEVAVVLREMRQACGYGEYDEGEDETDVDSLIGYKDALEDAYATLLSAAPLPEAIRRVQNMHDEAAAYFEEHDVPGEWLDAAGSWKDWDSEAEGSAAEAKVDALSSVLDVLTILAHGGTPEQGSSSPSICGSCEKDGLPSDHNKAGCPQRSQEAVSAHAE